MFLCFTDEVFSLHVKTEVESDMTPATRFAKAVRAFDKANSRDPHTDSDGRMEHPKELLYARRMSEWLDRFEPGASEALKLAARCQHLERWVIPREKYPMNRSGYIKWRNALKQYHADRADDILKDVGYDRGSIDRVRNLVMKKGLKADPEAQTLEDVVCLVFLQYYFEAFAQKHDEKKIVNILQKTWRKMSPRGRETALQMKLPDPARRMLDKALQEL